MFSFRTFLVEGGNIKVQGDTGYVGAESMDLRKVNRSERQNDIHDLYHAINNEHIATTGSNLFGPKGEAIKHGTAFAGSTKAFMDPSISDEEHIKHKPIVGDLDAMYRQEHKDTLEKQLTPGKTYGKFTLVGTKKHGSQISGIFKHDDGTHHQMDFEPAEYEGNHPSEWNQFSHSASWDDAKTGIKGVAHKFLLSSLTAAHGKPAIVRSKKGDAEKFAENDTFSVDKGLRTKHEEIGKEGARPVVRELTPKESTYTTDMNTIYQRLIGGEPTRHDVHKLGTFHGALDLAKNNLSPEQQSRVVDKFIHTVYHPNRAQQINAVPSEDEKIKDTALNFMRKKFPHHFTDEKEAEISEMKKQFYEKQAEKSQKKSISESKTDFNIRAAAGRFTGVSKEHEKLIDKVFSQPADKHYVFVMGPSTHEQTTEKDPFTVQEKIKHLQSLYPHKADSFVPGDQPHTKTPNQAMAYMWHKHKEDAPNLNLTMVAGSGEEGVEKNAGGSADNYRDLMNRYNGSKFPERINSDGVKVGGDYRMNYQSANVEENPRGTTSGSLVRKTARSLDPDNSEHVEQFRSLLHSKTTPEQASNMMKTIQERTPVKKIKEEKIFKSFSNFIRD